MVLSYAVRYPCRHDHLLSFKPSWLADPSKFHYSISRLTELSPYQVSCKSQHRFSSLMDSRPFDQESERRLSWRWAGWLPDVDGHHYLCSPYPEFAWLTCPSHANIKFYANALGFLSKFLGKFLITTINRHPPRKSHIRWKYSLRKPSDWSIHSLYPLCRSGLPPGASKRNTLCRVPH